MPAPAAPRQPFHSLPMLMRVALVMLWLGLAASVAPAFGQETESAPPIQPAADLATLAQDVKSRLTEPERLAYADVLDALPLLEEARKPAARDLLNSILTDLKSIDAAIAKTQDLEQRIANAPVLLDQIRTELALPPAAVEVPADQTVQQLEQGLAQAEAELKAARDDAATLETEAELRTRLREEIPSVIARTRQEIQRVDDEIASRTTAGPQEPLARLESLRLAVHRRSLEQTIASLEKEQQSIEARRDTLRARQDRATRRVSQAEKRVDAWRQKLNEAREAEARRVAADAKKALRQAANEHEIIKDLLRERTERAGRHEQLVAQYQQAQQERQSLESEVQTVRSRFLRSFEEIERAGLTNTVGIILGSRRSELPNVQMHEQRMRRRQQQLSDVLALQFELERRRDEIKDIGVAVEEQMDKIDRSLPEGERDAIRERAAEELRQLSGLLDKMIGTTRDLGEELSRADSAERALIAVTKDYANFIDERILWVRSTSALTWNDVKIAAVDAVRVADLSLWKRTFAAYRESVRQNPSAYLVLLLPVVGWLLLVFSSRRIARAREELAEELTRDRLRPSFRPTLKAMFLVLVSSMRWPLLLFIASLVLGASPDTPPATQAIVSAMRLASFAWLALEIGRQACRSGGFAEVHLRWPREAVTSVRRSLFWLICFVIPADVLFRIADTEGHELSSEPLARLIFIVGMIVIALFIQRTLRPHGPTLRGYFGPRRGGWVARLSGLWFLVLLCLPIFLAVLAGLGYFYSAQRLQQSMSQTFLLGLLMVIISALFYRWLWVTRRRVAIDQALKRRAAAQEQAESAEKEAVEQVTITEEEIDLPAANAQTLQLFHSAAVLTILIVLWGIWNSVLPALGLLNRFELWPHFGPVEVVSERPPTIADIRSDGAAPPVRTSESPAASSPSNGNGNSGGADSGPGLPLKLPTGDFSQSGGGDKSSAVHQVTIADLAMAIIIGVITLILTRNIPGLLEIAILQRLPMDAGSRYAVSTIVRYIIVIVGVMVTFGAIGIGWSQIQWLAAALTFGLAFGLQEIFANFISGLIILIERPMRVGDTVTIGDISGEVSRIRMRATTITQWNLKELIVPNREFITGQLVNWTLSDPTLRIEISVGIAYGSDTRLARSLLLKVANKTDTVLKDPPPRALFLNFGDSALNFELRVFISGLSHYVDTLNAIHFAIDDEFRKAGIEISFPQRDIHIRTIQGALPIQRAKVEDVEK